MTTDTDNQGTGQGMGGFLKRLLLAFLKLAVVFIILVILAGAAWLIYRRIDQSFDSITSRTETNRGRIDQTTDDLQRLRSANEAQQEQIDILEDTLAALEADMATEQGRRDELRDMLEEQITALIDSTGIISGNVTLLNQGLLDLQNDTVASTSDIDNLGGQVDGLLAELSTLTETLEETQTELSAFSAEEFVRMGQALIAFRAWESISRARLRLLEGNQGLAAADIEAATQALEGLVAVYSGAEEMMAALDQVQQRLVLASAGLPGDSAAATRDLETAWEVLDGFLAGLLGVPPASTAGVTAGTSIAPASATITATLTITPALTTVTPTPTTQ